MHSSAFPYATKLNLSGPIISYNGALIRHVENDKIIFHRPVSCADAVQVLKLAKKMGEYIQYYSVDNYYVDEHCDISDYYLKQTGLRAVAVEGDMTKAIDFDPTKLLIVCKNEKDGLDIYNRAVKIFSHKLNITRSNPRYIEFNSKEASKGVA